MESDLHRFQGYLDTTTSDANIYSEAVTSIQENRLLSKTVREGENVAAIFEQKCETLKGAVKFKPLILKETEFSFVYQGMSPKSCVVLSFHISLPTYLSCEVKTDPKLFENHGTLEANKLATVSSFLQFRIADFCEKVQKLHLLSPADIPSHLRRLEWVLGRLETTAFEIASLKDRYRNNVSLTRVADTPTFQLKLGLRSQPGLVRLETTLDITETYPFSPLNVCLDAYDQNVNVEALQALMVKKAKPGFGYLSRICDILTASLS
jgi:hypothetical protein